MGSSSDANQDHARAMFARHAGADAQARFSPPHLTPAPHAQDAARVGPQVAAASLMVWDEHCQECAAPACYASCDLYEPRADGRCRLLEGGFAAFELNPGAARDGAAARFKRWGRLEARGNTHLQPIARIAWMERWLNRAIAPLTGLGHLLARLTGQARFHGLAYALLEKFNRWRHAHRHGPQPDAFLIEVENPTDRALGFTLGMSVSANSLTPAQRQQSLPTPFAVAMPLQPGFNRFVLEARLFLDILESGLPFDVALTPDADATGHTLYWRRLDFVRFAPAPADNATTSGAAPEIKCVVWDLDNTLWDGTLVEEEPDAIRPETLALIQLFDQRGILQSIASKNSHDHAWPVLQRLGVAEYFLAPQIQWGPKSSAIRHIAQRLNIHVNTFAFIDDSPFERLEVSETIPEVLVIDAHELHGLADHPRLQGGGSAESSMRRALYQQAFEREAAQSAFGADYTAFLAACDITLTIAPYAEADRQRVGELMQRTNQLNFSGAKYGPEALTALLADEALEKWTLRVADRFGGYGLVGFSLVRRSPERIAIEEFMLSCRVQGKFIEAGFFHFLRAPAPKAELWTRFTPTGRNEPAQKILRHLEFAPMQAPWWRHAGDVSLLQCDFLRVQNPEELLPQRQQKGAQE
ncbi:HAD-IIIC family phosphatase [Magnetofaba australis]|uniref:Putative FkbH domain-containing protein n=1 Tax=Magnetofaba australis IT-1 TaxID=1434232 RepID=A0A1Y2K0F6_9PROT|nr:HAD-IIIC family phosphatase [Magnetofaba australis]OSM01523.1 putative FkbH domain-containing protein [Magnetofaba australis IT-1]